MAHYAGLAQLNHTANLGVFLPAVRFFLLKTLREWRRYLGFGAANPFYLPDHQESNSLPVRWKELQIRAVRMSDWSCWFQAANQNVPTSLGGVMLGNILGGRHQLEKLKSLQSECEDISLGWDQPLLFKKQLKIIIICKRTVDTKAVLCSKNATRLLKNKPPKYCILIYIQYKYWMDT